MSDRKSPVRLTDAERYQVYKYVIEHGCVYQNAEEISFRVAKEKIANEINLLNMMRHITGHHVAEAVERVVSWQRLLNKVPAPPQITVQAEQLKIENKNKSFEIEQLKAEVGSVKIEYENKLAAVDRIITNQKRKIDGAVALLK